MRGIKFLFVTAIVVAAIAAAAVAVMRAGRGKLSPATELQPGLYGIQSAGGIYRGELLRVKRQVILYSLDQVQSRHRDAAEH